MAHFLFKKFYGAINDVLEHTGRKLAIVTFGPPGSGKGQQRKVFQAAGIDGYEMSGHLNGLPEGHHAKKLMSAGEMVPDDDILHLWSNAMDKMRWPRIIVLDGIPRNPAQYEVVVGMLKDNGYDIVFIYFDVPNDICLRRRLIQNKFEKRLDVGQERKRLVLYHRKIKVVIKFAKTDKIPILHLRANRRTTVFGTAFAVLSYLQKHAFEVSPHLFDDVIHPPSVLKKRRRK